MSPFTDDNKKRKQFPVYAGFVKYFPDAMAAVAKVSFDGNKKHNPHTPIHWDRSKSGDELDAMMRHIIDEDWAQVAWRAMANLQKHIENESKTPKSKLISMEHASIIRQLYKADILSSVDCVLLAEDYSGMSIIITHEDVKDVWYATRKSIVLTDGCKTREDAIDALAQVYLKEDSHA